jgi:hypothetical protein
LGNLRYDLEVSPGRPKIFFTGCMMVFSAGKLSHAFHVILSRGGLYPQGGNPHIFAVVANLSSPFPATIGFDISVLHT